MVDLLSLNENQLEAVKWDRGSLLVLAGPGSGKTRVLTLRIAKILEDSAGQHFRILALTFTNKAAAEMRNRVEELIPDELHRIRLTTFHSFAAELLQQHGSKLRFKPDFQIISNDIDRVSFLDEVINNLRRKQTVEIPDHFTGSQILPAITRLLDRCIPIDEAENTLKSQKIDYSSALARVYKDYRMALCDNNVLDFPSLIAEALDLLKNNPFIVKHIRKVYKHILVDEFQDTNLSQYQLLSLIINPDPTTLFIVADDDQIIYQWNGASPKRIQALRDDYNVSEIQLPENYRCPPQVVQLANSLIEKNLNRSVGKKPLKAYKKGTVGDVIRVKHFEKLEDEVDWIARDIGSKPPIERNKCAVLARTKKLLDIVGDKLIQYGVPVYFAAKKNEFTSAPMRMLHSILRIVNTSDDRQSLARLSKAFYEIEGINIDVSYIVSKSAADGNNIFRTWLEEVKCRDTLSSDSRQLLEVGIKPLLNSLNYRSFSDQLFSWAKIFVNDQRQEDTPFNEYEEELEVWMQLVHDITKKFEGEEVSLHKFLHELDLTSKTPPRHPDSIPCFTIHASKGMEFGHVYLLGLVEDQLPSWAAVKKGDSSFEMQEERRNCFVAITRAQESLTLTYSEQVFGWYKKPSRFLSEMGIETKQ
ncbi:MAG: ATP-dependent helicase [Bacillota bacterium]|nr:ATP-dependent helicase [Bacillota bacterium]MDW7676764.1 ATP-dependent helicase [Bacillota bacterium]